MCQRSECLGAGFGMGFVVHILPKIKIIVAVLFAQWNEERRINVKVAREISRVTFHSRMERNSDLHISALLIYFRLLAIYSGL